MVRYLEWTYRVSERRGCVALRFDRSSHRYQSIRGDQAVLRQRIRDLAAARVRYGYFRIYILLRREGWRINHKRVYRLYREEGLAAMLKATKALFRIPPSMILAKKPPGWRRMRLSKVYAYESGEIPLSQRVAARSLFRETEGLGWIDTNEKQAASFVAWAFAPLPTAASDSGPETSPNR